MLTGDINLKMKGKAVELLTDHNGIVRYRGREIGVTAARFAANAALAFSFITAAMIIGLLFWPLLLAKPANAQQTQNNTLSPVGQQQQMQQGQAQGQQQRMGQNQQQRQGQDQNQSAVVEAISTSQSKSKSKSKANNEGVVAVNNNDFNDKRDAPSVNVNAPGFGSSVSDGYLNACAGTEAWSIGIGGSFLNSGSPIGAGLGGGSSDVVTINLCEVREAAHLVQMRGDGPEAEELHHAIMCQHPSYRSAAVAIGLGCPDIPPYTMEVATQEHVEEVKGKVQLVSTSSSSSGCEHGRNEWGRCINPDFDNL